MSTQAAFLSLDVLLDGMPDELKQFIKKNKLTKPVKAMGSLFRSVGVLYTYQFIPEEFVQSIFRILFVLLNNLATAAASGGSREERLERSAYHMNNLYHLLRNEYSN